MGTVTLPFNSWSLASWQLAWSGLWRKLRRRDHLPGCIHTQSAWRWLRGKRPGVQLQQSLYCTDLCLEPALTAALRHARSIPKRTPAVHRLPLGLLLLSRQQLTVEQLRAALAEQRSAGRGRIGEWLQYLGFATEQQVTAALARQWSCPVLRPNSTAIATPLTLQIPVTLLQSFVMIPVSYVEATATLHMAFGEGIDYTVLYAIEQMLGCHTEPCMAIPSLLRKNLATLSGHRSESEVVFDGVADATELARIIRSYCARVSASEIRLASCGAHLWVRLARPSRPPLDLLLRLPHEAIALTSFPAVTFPALAV